MPNWPGIDGCSSIFILASFTLPLAAFTAFSRTGVSCLHGPHQDAQKSTKTGWRLDSSITSLTKLCVVVSLIDTSGAAVPAGCNIFSVQFRPLCRAGANDPVCPIKWDERGRMQSG